MTNNISFEKVISEYREVAMRTYIVVRDHLPGQSFHANIIHLDDLIRQKELAKVLIQEYANRISDPSELFEIAKEADEKCTCGHSIIVHGSKILPSSDEKFTHYGRCLIRGCICDTYQMQKET